MVATPVAAGVSQVTASPVASLVTVQDEAPPQAESCTPLLALQPMDAPPTGVTPSAASTRTCMGLVACVPAGVVGFIPLPSKTTLSLAAAPKVSALLMMEDAPLTGSLIVMFWTPSPCAGAARIMLLPPTA